MRLRNFFTLHHLRKQRDFALLTATFLTLVLCVGCLTGCATNTTQKGVHVSSRSSSASSSSQDTTSSGSSSDAPSENEADTNTKNTQDENATHVDVDLEELSQSLPTKGLPERYIDQSWLGEHDKMQKENGLTTYSWLARNGTDDTIFSAYCKNGAVTRVAKHYFSSGYWPTLRGLPDLYTTTPFDNQDKETSNKYSPRDYDSAEEWEADTGGSLDEWERQ